MEKQTDNRPMDTVGSEEGEGEMYGESNMETYNAICKTATENLQYGSGKSNRGSMTVQKGGMWRDIGGRFGMEGTWVYLWLILDVC